jgi:hypothetical protein
VLEGANINLGSVVSDIMGVSSRDMLRAIAEGEDNPADIKKQFPSAAAPFLKNE